MKILVLIILAIVTEAAVSGRNYYWNVLYSSSPSSTNLGNFTTVGVEDPGNVPYTSSQLAGIFNMLTIV